MSKAGYGTPEEILKMDTELVMTMLEYEKVMPEYEEEYHNLNKDIK